MRATDPFLAREQGKYDNPLPSREMILSMLETAGIPVFEEELVRQLDITEEEYDRIMNINAKAVVLACQVFGRYFVKNKVAASIVNLGSMSGLTPLSRVFTYSMSKAAVHNLSKNLAREWAPLGIRVNTLVPGFFPAEQNRKVLTEDRVASIMRHTPAARFGSSNELIGAALLLAANGAGSFINGHELVVDGGYSSMTI